MDKALAWVGKFWPFIVIYILLLFIGHLCTRPEQKDPVIEKHYIEIDRGQHRVDSVAELLKASEKKRKVDSAKAVVREKAFVKKIASYEKKEVELRPEIEAMADSVPILKEYIAVRDSMNVEYKKRISELNVEKFELKHEFDLELKMHDGKFKAQEEMTEHFKEVADIYRKKYKKTKRANTWLKIGLVALAVVAAAK